MRPVTVLLADDHEIVRTGLRTFLETQPGITVVGEAGDGMEAVQAALRTRPDIVIMDLTMPGMDGLDATRRLKKEWPEAVVLALTVHEDKALFLEMLAAGAAGYLSKRVASDELMQAINAVAAGHAYLQPALARWLLEDFQKLTQQGDAAAPATGSLSALSERERQVLQLVAAGHTNPEIGQRLGLSPKTIARHRERIMKKLNLHSRTDLVKFAIRSGLTGID